MALFENVLRNLPRAYATHSELTHFLDKNTNSRQAKIKRLLKQGKLIQIRRGLYGLTEVLGYQTKPHPFELAQQIYMPSYISLESALSYHQLIPEAVYTITSTTIKRSKEFHTPLSNFSYLHLPTDNFYHDVDLVHKNNARFFMAKPWKAICDFVYCYKHNWNTLKPLAESLRINCDELPGLSDETIYLLAEYYQHKRLDRFLMGVKRELSSKY